MTLCQQVPADVEEKLRAVHAFTSESISEDLVSPDSLINMVEVLPSSDMLMSHTINKKGASVNLKTMGHKKTNSPEWWFLIGRPQIAQWLECWTCDQKSWVRAPAGVAG